MSSPVVEKRDGLKQIDMCCIEPHFREEKKEEILHALKVFISVETKESKKK